MRNSDANHLGSPNTMVWQYVKITENLIAEAQVAGDRTERRRHLLLLTFFSSVAIVETFMNSYFRILVEAERYAQHRDSVLKDIRRNSSLDHKIRKWPVRIFGKGVDLQNGAGFEFMQLKSKRNRFMHPEYTYETISLPKVKMEGMTDISELMDIRVEDGEWAMRTAEEFVVAIFKARGIPKEKIRPEKHFWLSRVPLD